MVLWRWRWRCTEHSLCSSARAATSSAEAIRSCWKARAALAAKLVHVRKEQNGGRVVGSDAHTNKGERKCSRERERESCCLVLATVTLECVKSVLMLHQPRLALSTKTNTSPSPNRTRHRKQSKPDRYSISKKNGV